MYKNIRLMQNGLCQKYNCVKFDHLENTFGIDIFEYVVKVIRVMYPDAEGNYTQLSLIVSPTLSS